MLKTILSHIDIYTDTVQTIKLPLEEYRLKIFESFVLGRRLNQNPRSYNFTDYTVPMIQHFSFFHDYIRDFFYLENQITLIFQNHFGNIYAPMEQSITRSQVNPQDLINSPDYTYIYGVDVAPASCELVIEYDDNTRKNKLWRIPLATNKFIIFPSVQRYFISQNKSANMNVFLTTNARSIKQ